MNVLHRVPGASKPRVNSPALVVWGMKFGTARMDKVLRALIIAAREGRILI